MSIQGENEISDRADDIRYGLIYEKGYAVSKELNTSQIKPNNHGSLFRRLEMNNDVPALEKCI
jgi:hypothetical protein